MLLTKVQTPVLIVGKTKTIYITDFCKKESLDKEKK